jgi:hypothetical protein
MGLGGAAMAEATKRQAKEMLWKEGIFGGCEGETAKMKF